MRNVLKSLQRFALVAQLDRASASEAEGCRFDSRRAHLIFMQITACIRKCPQIRRFLTVISWHLRIAAGHFRRLRSRTLCPPTVTRCGRHRMISQVTAICWCPLRASNLLYSPYLTGIPSTYCGLMRRFRRASCQGNKVNGSLTQPPVKCTITMIAMCDLATVTARPPSESFTVSASR